MWNRRATVIRDQALGDIPSGAVASASECACSRAARPVGLGARKHLPLLPAIALVLLPKCPLCLAAWFGIFGSVGTIAWVSAIWSTPLTVPDCVCPTSSALPVIWVSAIWSTPLTVGLLSSVIVALLLRARRSRDLRPLLPGMLGVGGVLAGRCLLESPALLYAGLAALLGASIWSSRLVADLDKPLPGRFSRKRDCTN